MDSNTQKMNDILNTSSIQNKDMQVSSIMKARTIQEPVDDGNEWATTQSKLQFEKQGPNTQRTDEQRNPDDL